MNRPIDTHVTSCVPYSAGDRTAEAACNTTINDARAAATASNGHCDPVAVSSFSDASGIKILQHITCTTPRVEPVD